MLQSARYLLRLVARRFAAERCIQVAGNLTFTTLLALVPLFTIALTLFAAFPVFDEWSNAFKVFLLTTLVPEVSGKVITVYMQQFADNAAKLTALGLVFLAVTALMLMVSIERVFNSIWRARRPRSVVQRLIIYWATITIGPLLLGASLSLTSWLVTKSMTSVGGPAGAQDVVLKVLPVLLNGAAFALLYLMIPNRRVMIKDAMVGGVAAAVIFEITKRGFGLYVLLFPTYALIYGTFATIPIFLLWVYLSWLVILLGAVIVAVLPQWRLGALRGEAPGGFAFFRALRLIELLQEARRRAETPGAARLSTLSDIVEEDVENLLERMDQAGWIRRVDPSGWVLARDLATLRVADVYRVFALDMRSGAGLNSSLVAQAAELLLRVEQAIDIPLQALIDTRAPAILSGGVAQASGNQKPAAEPVRQKLN